MPYRAFLKLVRRIHHKCRRCGLDLSVGKILSQNTNQLYSTGELYDIAQGLLVLGGKHMTE